MFSTRLQQQHQSRTIGTMSEAVDSYYKEHASMYADFADSSFSWKYLEKPGFDELIPQVDQDNTIALDIGCGNGRILRYLVSRGIDAAHITGLDPSDEMLDLARQSTPGVQLVQEHVQNMAFEQESFSLITSNMMMHTMDGQDAVLALKAIHTVLKPGGVCAIIDAAPDCEHINEWMSRRSPWGTYVPSFHHDPQKLYDQDATSLGFTVMTNKFLRVASDGWEANQKEYLRYLTSSLRTATLLRKCS